MKGRGAFLCARSSPGKVWCLPRQAGPDKPLVIRRGLQSTGAVILYTPDSEPQSLPFVIEQDALVVKVPTLNLTGVLAIPP